ncbi:MAG: hypothetical protein P8X85_23380, partial [Desulfobacterales bacterium]
MPLISDAKSQPRRGQLKIRIASNTAPYIALIIAVILIFTACSDNRQPDDSAAPPAVLPESFTFFDLGINSRFNEDVRQELDNKLGPDAIEQRSIMNLEINYKGFLKNYFPDLDELNRKLNFPPRER